MRVNSQTKAIKKECFEAFEDFNNQNDRNILTEWEKIIFHLPYAFHGRSGIDKMDKLDGEKWKIRNNFSEAGKPESKLDKDWIKKVSKSDI